MLQQKRTQHLSGITFHGIEQVQLAMDDGRGVLILPNHSSHADPFSIYAAADEIGTTFYLMATWHVFSSRSKLGQWLLQKHGCFSVYREANDVAAFKRAVGILQDKKEPLVIFPEGEIYHCNERTTPFREGAAAIGVAAARRAEREMVAIPCSIFYRYLEDPTDSLVETMGRLEEAIFWRRRVEHDLPNRIYKFAEALLGLKELEYYNDTRSGPLPERIRSLGNFILASVEHRHDIPNKESSVPERVKLLRKRILDQLFDDTKPVSEPRRKELMDDLADLFVVVQSFSYPGNYVSQKPTIERMAETIDKFEEDVLNLPTATIRSQRTAELRFGTPIPIEGKSKVKGQTPQLTLQVERSVQTMLEHSASSALPT